MEKRNLRENPIIEANMQQHSVSDKPRIVLVGAVDSTAQTLSKLVEHLSLIHI